MEKKDYLMLQRKYSFLKDYEERHRKELIEFVHIAFDKHNGVFELKPEGYSTWEERKKNEEFCPMDELPYYLLIGVKDDNSHEIHINRIRRVEYNWGYRSVEVDGWDWSESEFVEGMDASFDMDSLSTIAEFINAVLEQEGLAEVRHFEKNEEVCICEDGDLCRYAVVEKEQDAESWDDWIGVNPIGEDGKCSEPRIAVEAYRIYKKAEGKVCPRCNNPLYVEHHREIDYPYFCPECQENFYNIEVQ